MEPLHHNQELFEETIKRISLETGISEAIVEKDYYVNVSAKSVKYNYLDNTDPVLTTSVADIFDENNEAVSWKITASATDNISGIAGYALTKEENAPTEYLASKEFAIGRSGTYYIWTKDNAGNTTHNKVEIESDLFFNNISINKLNYEESNIDYLYYQGHRIRL